MPHINCKQNVVFLTDIRISLENDFDIITQYRAISSNSRKTIQITYIMI